MWCMRIACWTPKVISTQSKHVTIILDSKLSPYFTTSCSATHPQPVTHLPIGSARACLNPGRYKYPAHSNPCHTSSTRLWRWNRQRVPKRRFLVLGRQGDTQKKTHYTCNNYCFSTATIALTSLNVKLYVKWPSFWNWLAIYFVLDSNWIPIYYVYVYLQYMYI
jgi:hypothetical protein